MTSKKQALLWKHAIPQITVTRLANWKGKTYVPVVKKVREWTFIQCAFDNITIGGQELRCPTHPFWLNALEPFETKGTIHDVKLHVYNSSKVVFPNKFTQFNKTMVGEDMQDTFTMLDTILKLNEEIGRKTKELENKSRGGDNTCVDFEIFRLRLPTQRFWAFNIFCLVSVAGTIFWVIYKVFFSNANDSQSLVVNNNSPTQVDDIFRENIELVKTRFGKFFE